MMNKNKKILIIVITILLITIGVTFSYFMARTGDGANGKFNITSDTVDDLRFSVNKDLNLSVNQFNFASGSGNLSDEVVARASLKANSTKNTATYNYYVYFQIEKNEYIYTTTDKLPEVVLSITGPNGEITSVDGLSYVSATNADGTVVKGFDITELRKSVISIANNYEITSNSSTNYTNQDWTFKVTFINLDNNQYANENMSTIGKVLIQKDKNVSSLKDVCNNGEALSSCITNLYKEGDSSFTNLYYHDNNLENSANDNSYRYSGGDHDNLFICKYKDNVVYNYQIQTNSTLASDCDSLYEMELSGEKVYFDNSISSLFGESVAVKWDSSTGMCKTINGDEVYNYAFLDFYDLDYVDKSECSGNALYSNEYMYYVINVKKIGAGTKELSSKYNLVNNFVCFGTSSENCPLEYLYRIIGVFDGKVKLIKADYANKYALGTDGNYSSIFEFVGKYYKGGKPSDNIPTYKWNDDNTSTWADSLLNKVNLNTNFIDYIGSDWASMIDTTTWKVGGNPWNDNIETLNVSTIYQNEIVSPVSNVTYNAKIGLMYLSDYGYAAAPSAWSNQLYNYSDALIKNDNWLYWGLDDTTLYRVSDESYYYYVDSDGSFGTLNLTQASCIRPAFYLLSSVNYVSGDGSIMNPIRINLAS